MIELTQLRQGANDIRTSPDALFARANALDESRWFVRERGRSGNAGLRHGLALSGAPKEITRDGQPHGHQRRTEQPASCAFGYGCLVRRHRVIRLMRS